MAAVESDLPPSIPHPIADATDTLHASNAVESIHELDPSDNQPLATDANDTLPQEVTKPAFDNSASALVDASLGSMKLADISENAAHETLQDTSNAEEPATANNVEARDIPESTTTLDKSATQDSLMEDDAKAEDTHVKLTEQTPVDLSSSNLSTATTETPANAVPVSETTVPGTSEDKQLPGSAEIQGHPVPSNNAVEEPVVGKDVTETASNKPDEELERENTTIVAETNSAEKDGTTENHLVVGDAETKVDGQEAPAAEMASTVESKALEGKVTISAEQSPLEAEVADHSTTEDVLGSDKESKLEADRADVSVVEGGAHEEPMKVEPKEADEHEGNSVEPAVGGQGEDLEPTETSVESTIANDTPVPAVPAVENSNLETSGIQISTEPKEEAKTSGMTITPPPDAQINDLSQVAVEEPAPSHKEEAVELTTATTKEASIEEKEVANPNVEEPAADSATEPPVVESQSYPAAEVEADSLAEEHATPKGEENASEFTNSEVEPVVEKVEEITPESTQREATEQETSVEMSNEPFSDDAIQQAPAEQPPPEEIAAPAEAEVAEQSVVEAAADPVSEVPVIQESPSSEAPVPSEVTAESVVNKVEEVPIAEETTEVEETDVEHEVVAEESSQELVEEVLIADQQPPADLAPIQDNKEQPSEKVEEVVEEQASPAVEVSQDEKDSNEVPATEVEDVTVEGTSVEVDEATVEDTPAEAVKASVEDVPAEVETAPVDESPAEIEKIAVDEVSTDTEKPAVEEVPAETEPALVDETPVSAKTDVQESEVPELAVEEHSSEAPTTIEGEQSQVNEAVVVVKDEVIENVTEAVSEQTIVDSVPVDKGTTEVLHELVDVPASKKEAVEISAEPTDEKEEVALKQDVEQTGEPEQVQHIPSVVEGDDTILETAEVSVPVEAVPVVLTELVVEEADEDPISENLTADVLAAEIPGQSPVEASVVEGQVSEESKAETVEETAPHNQLSEAVVSHEIGDTGTVNSKDSTQEAVPCMDDSLVSEISEADTTAETIIVPESVAQKKLDSASPVIEEIGAPHVDEAPHDDIKKESLRLDISREATPVERPKSPWTPSFQVTTIGQGVSLPPDDILTRSLDDSEDATVIPSEDATVTVNGGSNEAPVNVSDESENELQSTSSLWTPSYSVHSQGSPNPPFASLKLENPATADEEVKAEADEPTVEQTLVHEDAAPSVTKESEQEHVECQPPEAEQAEQVAVETMNVAEEPVAALENAIPESRAIKEPSDEHFVGEVSIPVPTIQEQDTSVPESPAIKEPFDEDFVEEVSIPVPIIQEQDTSVVPASKEEEDLPALEIASTDLHVLEQVQQHNTEDDSSLTTPGHQSGSASPSWVPSYSVSRQGSPLPRPVALPSADISEIRLAPLQTNASQEDTQNDALKDAASSVTAPTVVIDGAEVAEAEKAQLVEDHPSTPWTPSYSVTVQGADVLEETAIESLSSPPKSEKAKEPEVRQRRSLSEEMESGAFSPTALIGAGFAGGAAVYAASAALRNSNDGRTSTDVAEPQIQQEKHFPTVEIPDGTKHHTVQRSDGNEAMHATVARSPETSPTSSRKRLESTTSSRLFPGGWFSTSSTIPDERTSLEVAQGEFASVKEGGSAEGFLQSPTSPTAEPITPVREQSSSDKRKWCIIM